MDLDAAIEKGKAQGRPVLMNFTGSDWCGYCIQIGRNVFPDKTWQSYASNNLMLVTLDFPLDKTIVPARYENRNEAIRDQLQISGFPTFVILDPASNAVVNRFGAFQGMTPVQFTEQVRRSLRQVDSAIAREEQLLAASAIPRYLELVSQIRKVEADFSAWLKTRPLRSPENMKIFEDFSATLEGLHRAADALVDSGRQGHDGNG
ncbi:MAG: thioredoxin family protein [Verrucomicrobia bacterium]|nr:thioredoxin family protein [Verrucomicrobiota bacterium]